jgi:inhibitor of cysteine peptidase
MDQTLLPNERWLTEADAGRTVDLRKGDRLSISLGGNPTTGYSWQVAGVDEQVLAPLGNPGYTASSEALGAGGVFAFAFEAVAAGQTALRLVYRRPWEKRRRPAQTFKVDVTVGAAAPADQ